jgi:hypothetical protein
MYTVPSNPRPSWWRPQWEHLHILLLAFWGWLQGAYLNNKGDRLFYGGTHIHPCGVERMGLSVCFSLIALGLVITAGIYLFRSSWRTRIMVRFYLGIMILTGIMLLQPRLSSIGIAIARDTCTALLQRRVGF